MSIIWVLLLLIITLLVSFLIVASFVMHLGIYIKALCSNPQAGKVIALTFDDGPDPIQTPKVLDILKEYNVKACFFCIGNKIAGNEHIIKRIIKEGHLIGNHSHSHSNAFPLYSYSNMLNDISTCNKKIEEVTGYKTVFFRPPFGVTNPTIAKVVKKLGLCTIGWNIRTFDTYKTNQIKILKKIKRKLSNGSIILLHDKEIFSDTLLKNIILLIKQNNYNIVRVDKLFNNTNT